MEIAILVNKHLAHVIIADGEKLLMATSQHPSEVVELLKHCKESPIPKGAEKFTDQLSYSKPYKLYFPIDGNEVNVKHDKGSVVSGSNAPAKPAKKEKVFKPAKEPKAVKTPAKPKKGAAYKKAK
jgi:hypothetical protein